MSGKNYVSKFSGISIDFSCNTSLSTVYIFNITCEQRAILGLYMYDNKLCVPFNKNYKYPVFFFGDDILIITETQFALKKLAGDRK